jgi:D-alanine-D-alanine ligase
MKKVVGVIYGGRSAEHDVSILSGKSVLENLDREKFEIKEIFIDKEGSWQLDKKPVSAEESLKGVDIAFPILHGTFGEDGTIQGLFEMLGIPFVGCGVLESALGMDKEFSKIIWSRNKIPVVNFVAIQKRHWTGPVEDERWNALDAAKNLKFPVFVKPASLGSSVGIRKVKDKSQLESAIDHAFEFGAKVIVEEGVEDAREIEISIIGNNEIEASVCGEIVPANEFYDYAAKYHDENSELKIPASIDEKTANRISETAKNAYKSLGLYGLARADFLLNSKENKFYLSEVNTMPGFTSISMYPKLWEVSGLSYKNLLTKLIDLGFVKHQEKLKYRLDK